MAYDANNNPGPRTLCSGLVDGTGTGGTGGTVNSQPDFTAVGVDVINDGTGIYRNKIWWQTNQAAERPGSANGAIQVTITAFNSIETPAGAIDITSPVPRFVWQDFEDNYANTPDTANSIPLYGSMLDTNARIQTVNPKYSVWIYSLTISSGSIIIGGDHIRIGGNYSQSTGGGLGGGGFRPPLKT